MITAGAFTFRLDRICMRPLEGEGLCLLFVVVVVFYFSTCLFILSCICFAWFFDKKLKVFIRLSFFSL